MTLSKHSFLFNLNASNIPRKRFFLSYSIGQVAQKTGLSAYTLRYYEKEGLLPFVKKSDSGMRVYTDSDIAWLSMIECLKATGMPIKEIRLYIKWYNEGDATLSKRLALFRRRRLITEQKMKDLQKIQNKIEFKIHLYEEAVKAGSLETVSDTEEMRESRQRLFGDAHFFPTVDENADEAASLSQAV